MTSCAYALVNGGRLGVVYPQTELQGDPEAVRQVARATEELGFDHLLAYDHVLGAEHADREPRLTGPYTEHDPFHEPLVTFGYIAGITRRIELVTGVLVLPQRPTALVAKQCADLDLLCGERLRIAVGSGWGLANASAVEGWEVVGSGGTRSFSYTSYAGQTYGTKVAVGDTGTP